MPKTDKAVVKGRLLTVDVSELTKEERTQLFERAEQGDKTVLPQMRRVLDYVEERTGGPAGRVDLAQNAIESLIHQMNSKNLLLQELTLRELRVLRTELSGPSPSPLEALLVDRICACWLQLHYYDAVYAHAMQELTIRQAAFHQDRIDRANRRYLAAIKALAQVRRLLGPVVQVNIAEKQVNIIEASAAAPSAQADTPADDG